jgi:hypothetical protein
VSPGSTKIELKPWKPLGAAAARAVKVAAARLVAFSSSDMSLEP